MALNAGTLGTLIKSTLDAAMGSVDQSDPAAIDAAFCNAIATAVVSHIQSSGQAFVVVSGVTAGAATVLATGTLG